MEHFGMGWDEVLWGRSWVNVNMLMASVPRYESKNRPGVEEVTSIDQIADLLI